MQKHRGNQKKYFFHCFVVLELLLYVENDKIEYVDSLLRLRFWGIGENLLVLNE